MMPAHWAQYRTYIREHERTFIAGLLPLLEQPSVSHQAADVRHCAELLRDLLQHEGVHAEIMETGGNPVVYGEIAGERDDVTVVLYTHRVVKANYAFKKGQMTEQDVEKIVTDVKKILPEK